MSAPTMTTQRQVRARFWRDHPEASRSRVRAGDHLTYVTDTRCAFVDYVDHLARNGQISEALAARVTL